MVPILLILALAGQCLGMESEQELAQVSGAARHAHLASPSDGVQLHRGANIFNSPSESCDVKLDAEGLARSLSSDDPASSHPVTVLPAQHRLSITIDAETAGGSKPNEVVQTPTSFTDLTQPEPSNAEGQSAIDQNPAALENNYFTNPHSDTRPSTSCPSNARIPQSREAKSHAETSQENDECAICLDDVHASIVPDLKCKHLFHEQCIHDWIRNYRQKNHLNCPRCTQALAKEESPASDSDKNSAFWEHLAKLKGPVSKNGGSLSRTELGGQFLTFSNTRIDPRRLLNRLSITVVVLAVLTIASVTDHKSPSGVAKATQAFFFILKPSTATQTLAVILCPWRYPRRPRKLINLHAALSRCFLIDAKLPGALSWYQPSEGYTFSMGWYQPSE
ncbi:hypothetical protein PCASD_17519 [Puccinia coronata f. sp. avenae]|uniref:RING-type domain-containing protein n=1 Tax=Puccinia coronata f. sp. avenae TaxID=200324 RepID=A0A2N5T3V3_9BASI|nr:hypothetical protein PCASD_17519 [Puccinia coronata f. sp. avenae]